MDKEKEELDKLESRYLIPADMSEISEVVLSKYPWQSWPIYWDWINH